VTDLAACDAAAAINGIDVRSSDRHVEQARVTVLALEVTLPSMNPTNLVRPSMDVAGANNVTRFSNRGLGRYFLSPSLSKLPRRT
jgi:hypothetical protein